MLTPDETKENFSILLSITDEAGAEIKLRNKIADAWYGVEEGATVPCTIGTGSANLKLAQGVYKIVYNVAEDKATVEEVAKSFWLAGVLKGEGHWNCKSGIEFEKDNADWLYGEQIAAIKIILVDAAGNVTWYGSGADNVMITEVGTYTITLEGEVVTAVKQ